MIDKDIVIFDIDGTLADNHHRQHHLYDDPNRKDWSAFFAECCLDKPVHAMFELLRMAFHFHKVVYCTGRGEEHRQVTLDWLKAHGADTHYSKLLMRPLDDHRPDYIVKKEMLDKIGKERVLFVVEDRKSVVEMWRSEGIMCLQCAEGAF